MSPLAPFARLTCLLLLGFGLVGSTNLRGAAAQDADDAGPGPDFSGVWVFNDARSDDLRKVVEEAVGPEHTQGAARGEAARAWIRRGLLAVLENPDSRYLTIEQTPLDFKTGLGDEVSIYYFDREASSRGPEGSTLRASVRWQGPQLVTERKADDGSRIMALYTMLPGNNTLIVAYLLEHSALKKPLEARLFFDRDADED